MDDFPLGLPPGDKELGEVGASTSSPVGAPVGGAVLASSAGNVEQIYYKRTQIIASMYVASCVSL